MTTPRRSPPPRGRGNCSRLTVLEGFTNTLQINVILEILELLEVLESVAPYSMAGMKSEEGVRSTSFPQAPSHGKVI